MIVSQKSNCRNSTNDLDDRNEHVNTNAILPTNPADAIQFISSLPSLSMSLAPYSGITEPAKSHAKPTQKPMRNLTNNPSYQKASHCPTESATMDTCSLVNSDLFIHETNPRSDSCLSLHEILTNDHPWLSSKLHIESGKPLLNTQSRQATIRYDLESDFLRPTGTWSTGYHPTDNHLPTTADQCRFDGTVTINPCHITDEYLKQQNRRILHGDLCMTYGRPQYKLQTRCLPIGVALTYDQSTVLSCDVHRTAEHVRLFDVQTGQLRHTICSNPKMKLHRPSAVLGHANDTIVIVEKDSIYITESDGRWIQTMTHPSIKQLYGIALFRDRYLLTLDSKSMDNHGAEACRLLLFDPVNGQLVVEQSIVINRQSKNFLQQQEMINHVRGSILPETCSKPRFLAVHNDRIYISDLGRSLIYGTSLGNPSELTYMTIFGGHGRADGEMIDPSGLCIDSGGNIISADSKNDRIQLFSSNGEYRTTMQLNEYIKRPSGICTNREGTQLYVSCYLAGCVHAFNLGC